MGCTNAKTMTPPAKHQRRERHHRNGIVDGIIEVGVCAKLAMRETCCSSAPKNAEPLSKRPVPSTLVDQPAKKFVKFQYVSESEDFKGFEGPEKDAEHPVEDVYKCVMRSTGVPHGMVELFADGMPVPLEGSIAAAGLKDGQILTFRVRAPQTAKEIAKFQGASEEWAVNTWLKSVEGSEGGKHSIDAALVEAISAGNEFLCRRMMAAGASIEPWHLHTAAAAENEAPGIVKMLVQAGLKPNSRGGMEETPLVCALGHSNHVMAEALLKAGADPNRGGDRNGQTPLQHCTITADVHGLELLLKHGADVSRKDADGKTALHEAAGDEADTIGEDRAGFCALLLEAGAKVDAKDDEGQTPLQLAAFAGHMEVCLVLLESDADPTKKAKDGCNALDCARQEGHDRLYNVLRQAAADQRANRGFFGKRKRH